MSFVLAAWKPGHLIIVGVAISHWSQTFVSSVVNTEFIKSYLLIWAVLVFSHCGETASVHSISTLIREGHVSFVIETNGLSSSIIHEPTSPASSSLMNFG